MCFDSPSDLENKKDKTPVKGLGDPAYRPVTQNVGAFALEGAAEHLEMIEQLARGYIYTNKERPQICAHNAEVWSLISSCADAELPATGRHRCRSF